MNITLDITDRIAKLSGVRLSESERDVMARDLASVVRYFDLLNELDTSNVKPRSHVQPRVNHWRADEVRPSSPRDELIINAPQSQDGYVVSPKTFEGGGSS